MILDRSAPHSGSGSIENRSFRWICKGAYNIFGCCGNPIRASDFISIGLDVIFSAVGWISIRSIKLFQTVLLSKG